MKDTNPAVREAEFHWHYVFRGQFLSPFRTTVSLSVSDHYHPLYPTHIYAHGQIIFRWLESGPRSWQAKFCRSTKLLDLSDFQSKFIWRRWSLVISYLCRPLGHLSVLKQNRCLQKTVKIIFSHTLAWIHVMTSSLITISKTGQWNCQADLPSFLDFEVFPCLPQFSFSKMGTCLWLVIFFFRFFS